MEGKDSDSRRLHKKCKISRLDSFIDATDKMLVGRRLKISYIRDDCKYPKLLPKKGKVSNLIKKHCHNKVAHGGREFTLNDIQGAVYWIV